MIVGTLEQARAKARANAEHTGAKWCVFNFANGPYHVERHAGHNEHTHHETFDTPTDCIPDFPEEP